MLKVDVLFFLPGSLGLNCGQTRLKAPGPMAGGSEFEEAAWPSQARPTHGWCNPWSLVNGIVFVTTLPHVAMGQIPSYPPFYPLLRMNILRYSKIFRRSR